MSMQPREISPVPEETARVAHAANPHGNTCMRMRDELGSIYTDQLFASLFPRRGQPAEAPWRLALVTVMQYMQGLSDRQAAEAVREHTSCTPYSSCARVVAGGTARGRQRTDSTHVLAAIRDLNRLECVGETLRHTLNVLAEVAPDWLLAQIAPEWFERYSRRFDEYRFPKAHSERLALAETIGADGHRLLAAVYEPMAPAWLRDLPAVETLRRVWVQHYDVEEGRCRWRSNENIPPPSLLIASPYDLDAHLGVKRTQAWIGYKVHLTETCDEDAAHLIVYAETTAATTPDWVMTEPIHRALAAQECLPRTHVVDGGYVDADALVKSRATHAIELLGPVPLENSSQAKAAQGFDLPHFHIHWQEQSVTCPIGKQSRSWTLAKDRFAQDTIVVRFAPADCQPCPCRVDCTHAKGGSRSLTFRPQQLYLALQAARTRQPTDEFREQYAVRAGIAGTLSQALRVSDLRQARVSRLAKDAPATPAHGDRSQWCTSGGLAF